MTSNMIYFIALGVGFKCPRKIHLNTQCPVPLKYPDVFYGWPLSLFLPQVLQKNIGLFSFLSQLAHFGISSQVDSTRNRSKWSEGGSEWPSRRGVNFLQIL